MSLVIATRDSTDIGLSVAVSPTSRTVTGVVVAIRDESRTQTPPFYLDFADNTFKQAGWTTRQAALTSLGDNFFSLDGGFDLAATDFPATSISLAAEYEATTTGPPRVYTAVDQILMAESFVGTVWDELRANHTVLGSYGVTVDELYAILGLDPTRPLKVSKVMRSAGGSIIQTIFDDGTTVTVTRT
jgi:hypothetical protein